MNIQIYSSFEDVKQIWEKFELHGNYHGFQTYDWLFYWYETIGKTLKHKLFFIYVCNNNDLPLIFLPLIIEYNGAIRILKWQGAGFSDYQAPLLWHNFSQIIGKNDFETIWQNILNKLPKFDAIHFNNIPEDVMFQKNPFTHLGLVPKKEKSYGAHLVQGESWNAYYIENVNKSIRADSKRQRKRLSELGTLEFILANDANDIESITEKMILQKRRRYHETGVRDIFTRKNVKDFYIQTALALVPIGKINVAALKLNGRILATHWGLISNNTFYYLMPTYEGAEWKKFSCGRILLEFLLEWSFERKLNIFDFTGGGEEYKKIWCNQEMKLYDYIVPKTLLGKGYCLINHFKTILRRYPKYLKLLRPFLS